MKRVKLIVAYDGTGYCGWQVQPNEITVEGVLNKHISELTGEDIKVIGASRTDSGGTVLHIFLRCRQVVCRKRVHDLLRHNRTSGNLL